MNILLLSLIFISLLPFVAGVSQFSIYIPNYHVYADEGQKLTVPCTYWLNNPMEETSIDLQWGIMQDNNFLPSRSHLDVEKINAGHCSLVIDSIKKRDAGKYMLRLSLNGGEYQESPVIHLHVRESLKTATQVPDSSDGLPERSSGKGFGPFTTGIPLNRHPINPKKMRSLGAVKKPVLGHNNERSLRSNDNKQDGLKTDGDISSDNQIMTLQESKKEESAPSSDYNVGLSTSDLSDDHHEKPPRKKFIPIKTDNPLKDRPFRSNKVAVDQTEQLLENNKEQLLDSDNDNVQDGKEIEGEIRKIANVYQQMRNNGTFIYVVIFSVVMVVVFPVLLLINIVCCIITRKQRSRDNELVQVLAEMQEEKTEKKKNHNHTIIEME